MQVFGYVYLLVDETNGKMYVGKTTKTVEERFQKHRYSDTYIGRAIYNHKPENFKREILKICYSEAELNAWERFFIAALKTKAPYGYNLADGGKGDRGGKSGLRRGYSPFKNLLTELDAHRMTYEDLAKILGLSKQTISDKMHGRVGFTLKDRIKLVEIFGKPIEYLLERVDGKNSAPRRLNSPFKNLLIELDAHGLDHKALAKILGQSPKYICAKIRGERNFTKRDKAKLVEIFGKPIEYLLYSEVCFPQKNKHETSLKISLSHRGDTPYKNLLREIDAHQLTYTALAKLMGLSYPVVSAKMRGIRKFTERDKAKLVEIFGKPIEYLLERFDS